MTIIPDHLDSDCLDDIDDVDLALDGYHVVDPDLRHDRDREGAA